jgi:23S rRNA A2030 N6-methylase RlmJ
MAIINPPWQFEEQIAEILPWLWKALTINGQGAYRIQSVK